jgi:hypothetical protein
MARPIGIAKATKDNSNKHPHMREEWMEAKKIGRKKQRGVSGFVEHTGQPFGYWEKVTNG